MFTATNAVQKKAHLHNVFMDESDRAGHRTHCCWRMGCRRRPVNMEGATTHSRLRAALWIWIWIVVGRAPNWDITPTSTDW